MICLGSTIGGRGNVTDETHSGLGRGFDEKGGGCNSRPDVRDKQTK